MQKVRKAIALSLAVLGVAGCVAPGGKKPAPSVTVAAPTKSDAWLRIASNADQERIANASGAWAAGLAEARRNFASAVKDEGALLKQDASLARPAPTPGSYRCRVVSLGSTTRAKLAFERFRPFFCYVEVEGNLLTIVKQTGSTRPAGRLWEDDDPKRLVFLGSLSLGNEEEVKAYGDDPKRDMAGVFERIGPFVWRLVIPWPQDGAKLQVFELTPVADQPK
ncbi:MAG: DUF4893 domain-containing protein [Sphingomicrobium sp.]